MDFYVSGTSDVGIKRKVNQDSILARKFETEIGNVVFACMCDGMGGLQHGELASATLVHAFRKWSEKELPFLIHRRLPKDELFRQWNDIVIECNTKIMNYGAEKEISLGTTVTAMLITEMDYYIVNVGDSRAYLITDTAVQLTHDHTFVQQEIDLGRMTEEEAKTSRMGHILTQCVGARPGVSPDFFSGKTTKGAVYLLCSDGFRHKISPEEMAQPFNVDVINSPEELKRREAYLIELNKGRNESDNISVITVMAE